MKIYRKRSGSFLACVCVLGVLTLLWCSCAKTPIEINTSPPATSIKFIQASPDEPPVDLLLNSVRFGSSSFTYGQNSGYVNINTGIDAASFNNDINGKAILADTLNFKASAIYSLFLANKPSQPEVVLLTDTLNPPAAGNSSIRFINLSPDAPAVDLVIKGGAVLVANRSYKGYSSFAPIQGGVYTLEVHQAGKATVLASTYAFKLQTGSIYTVWFHGLVANTSTADQLAVDVIDNGSFSYL